MSQKNRSDAIGKDRQSIVNNLFSLDVKRTAHKRKTALYSINRVPFAKASKPNVENANATEINASLFFVSFPFVGNKILRMRHPLSREKIKNKASI
jgi:hypothetical protein